MRTKKEEINHKNARFNHEKHDKTSKLKIIVLGGLEEVGRNMTMLEYENDIIIIDMGLQFPEEDMPGIDYIIPNISYLKDQVKKIRGVFITHGHYDHIGAIPHLIPKLGNPVIFGTPLTLGIIAKRQEDYKSGQKLKLKTINVREKIKLGSFEVEFFRVSHNIPDSVGLIVHTPEGIVVHTGDFKFDINPVSQNDLPDIAKIAQLSDKNVLALMADSTNAESPGHQLTEKEIEKTLGGIFAKAPGRIIVGTFSSLLSRVQQIIWLAEKMGRKIVIEGYGMKTNVEIAHQLGYLKFRKGTIIGLNEALKMPSNKIIIICTGAQGEDRAVLMRIANNEHPKLKVEKGDTIIFSSSVVPGNERSVQKLKDSLYRMGAEVIHYQMLDVHAGGHAKQEDLKLLLRLINPLYLIPIEGNYFLLKAHEKVALSMGFNPKNIFLASNGQIMEFSHGVGKMTNKKVPTDYVMVDGLGIGDVGNVVLRERKMMSEGGMVVIIASIDNKTGELIGNPDIISRGFVYMKERRDLIEQTRFKAKKILQDKDPRSAANETYLKNKIRDDVGQFLFTKTEKRPMILPVIILV